MIVVEGPDGAGKTTLIESLVAGFNFDLQERVVKADTTAMTDLKDWVNRHNLLGWDKKRPRLYDRHRLISEFIYGPVMGRDPEPGFDDLDWVSSSIYSFYSQAPLIIYCLPPLEVVRENVQREDTDNSVVASKIDQLWVAYSRLASNDCLFHGALLWDYTGGKTEWLTQRILEEVYVRTRRY